jgi:hypothetical protein
MLLLSSSLTTAKLFDGRSLPTWSLLNLTHHVA